MDKNKEIHVDYSKIYDNNFTTNVKKAVQFYLEQNNGDGFILYPHALNPFLKIIETMGESKNIVILPAFNNCFGDEINNPAYMVFKINGEAGFVSDLIMTS